MGGLHPDLFLLQVLPGDAILIKFQNPDLGLSPQQIAEMRVVYGADSPLWQQYFHTLLAMLQGDFGYSLQAGLPVSSLIASNLPDTLALALPAFALAVLLAFAIAIASRLPGLRSISNLLQSLPVLFISLPTFWLGIALIKSFHSNCTGSRLSIPDLCKAWCYPLSRWRYRFPRRWRKFCYAPWITSPHNPSLPWLAPRE